MAIQANEVDCEAIIKDFLETTVAVEELEDRKKSLDPKLWSFLSDYREIKNQYESTEPAKKDLHNLLLCKVKGKSSTFLEQKLVCMNQMYTEMTTKSQERKEMFQHLMKDLHNKLQKLSCDLNNEHANNGFGNNIKSLNYLSQEIVNANKEMKILKDSMKNIESSDMFNTEMITKIIQKESFEQYQNPLKIQVYLTEMRRNLEVLAKKTQEAKIKYDV